MRKLIKRERNRYDLSAVLLVSVGALVGTGQSVFAQAPGPDAVPAPVETTRENVARIAESYFERIDLREKLLDEQTTLKIAERKAEAEYKRAKLTLEVVEIALKEYGKGNAELDANLKRARKAVTQRESEYAEATSALSALAQRIQEESPTHGEEQALILIDEGGELEAKGQARASQAKFDEAIRLWRAEHTRRADLKFQSLLRRVHQAVEVIKSTRKAG